MVVGRMDDLMHAGSTLVLIDLGWMVQILSRQLGPVLAEETFARLIPADPLLRLQGLCDVFLHVSWKTGDIRLTILVFEAPENKKSNRVWIRIACFSRESLKT